jgi:site-specific DNA-cytosine methylase
VRVLVACEYSATVRDAFRARGFDAWSCDMLPTEGDPRWHIQGDALEVVYGQSWDLVIAHPPCQYLTYAGAAYWNNPGRAEKRNDAFRFFMAIYNSPAPYVAIENPRGYPSKAFRQQDQEVNPFDFGTPERKRICLWLKGLPPLTPTNRVEVQPRAEYVRKTGARAGQVYRAYFHQGKNAKERARFFPSVAAAMADQWGDFIRRDRARPYCFGEMT